MWIIKHFKSMGNKKEFTNEEDVIAFKKLALNFICDLNKTNEFNGENSQIQDLKKNINELCYKNFETYGNQAFKKYANQLTYLLATSYVSNLFKIISKKIIDLSHNVQLGHTEQQEQLNVLTNIKKNYTERKEFDTVIKF